jgi:hypothetical protein
MRLVLGFILTVALSVLPTMAVASGEGNSSSADATASDASTSKASAGATAKMDAAAEPSKSSFESEIEELRDLLQTQAKQLKDQQQKVQLLEEQLKASNTPRENLAAAPGTAVPATFSVSAASSTIPAASTPQPVMATPQGGAAAPASPLQLQIGNAFITPVGFMDFTGVFRNHNAGGGIGSNFAAIPYEFPTSTTGINLLNHATEARLNMQNSRLGLRVDAMVKGAHVIGYMESDFLGNNPGNVSVSSNSNTLRSRLYWVDVAKDKWEFLGGQTWSLITPGRSGISPLPGNLFFSQDIDVNYQVGLSWGRIPEFRFVYHPSSKAAIAFALDNQEQYVGGSAGGPKITLPTGATVVNGVTGLPGSQLNDGSTGTNTPQLFPDLIVKVALDPSPKFHVEFGGVERQFRVDVNSTTSSSSPIVHQSLTGGGAFLNLNFQLFNGFRVLTNNYWSEAGGRYIFGQVPDVIIRPDGSLSAINAYSTVSGFEYTHKNTLLYSYYGGVYADRNVATVNGAQYGYGVDATGANYSAAISQNRSIQEGTFGFNQTLWRDTKYGALNLMGQYSYITRNPWSVAAGNPSHASLNIAFVNLRYTLPGAAPAASALK